MAFQFRTINIFYRAATLLWYLFILTLPFGTRLIIKPRLAQGVFVEWGTVSMFVSEIVLLFFCFFVFLFAVLNWQTAKGRILEYKKVIIALAVFLALVLISAINSQFFAASCWQFLRLLEVSLLLLSVIILRPSFKTTALIFSLSLIPSLVLGVFQFGFQFSPANKWFGIAGHLPEVLGTSVIGGAASRFLRAYGIFAHPNIFAAYLVANFWVLVYLILKTLPHLSSPSPWEGEVGGGGTKSSGRRILFLIFSFLFFLNLYCLFIAFSRAAWLALAVSLLVAGCWLLVFKSPFISPFEKGGLRGILILFSALLIFVSILVYLHSDLVFSRFGGDSYLEVKSVSERMAGYAEAKEIIFKSSSSSLFEKGGLRGILFGAGPGAYTYALAEKFPELSPYALQPVHNVWLLILAELGIFGFLAFVLFLIQIMRQSNSHDKSPFISPFSKGGLRGILFVVLLVLSLFDHYLWSLWHGLALLFLVLSCGLFGSPSQRPK